MDVMYSRTITLPSLALLWAVRLCLFAALSLWIWTLLKHIRRSPEEFPSWITPRPEVDWLIWLLIVIFCNVLGAIAYWVCLRTGQTRVAGRDRTAGQPQKDERDRILSMLADGTISVDESKELLDAFEKTVPSTPQREARERVKAGPLWPWALAALFTWYVVGAGLARILGIEDILQGYREMDIAIPLVTSIVLPIAPWLLAAGLGIGLAMCVFWLGMLIDCLTRPRAHFRTKITPDGGWDKLVWLAVLVLLNLIGAAAYYVLVCRPARCS